ncbi:PREDICTED: alpha-(1,3)-fucosyltransferase C-like [Priapulus caudatus]|uniref:Fucosyltransferase n=1 Tax=Priapulus caudatus TaxID=37621 RepID=A0ABM1EX25_PRICU|nr:PREDICTED: alpha-(1,3)-fucosyltransferase C-like [Priapulus caudatus]
MGSTIPSTYIMEKIGLKRYKCQLYIVFTLLLLIISLYFVLFQKANMKPNLEPSGSGLKLILFWNTFYGNEEYYWGLGHEAFKKNCPTGLAQNCETSSDKKLLKKADAIVMFTRQFSKPHVKYQNQQWVFFNVEPPPHSFDSSDNMPNVPQRLSELKNVFDLTMTYRLDSDAIRTYGQMVPFNSSAPHNFHNYAEGKEKLIAWFVSHCDTSSNRMAYVDDLKQHVDVDIYGDCGDLKCPRFSDECNDMVNKKYKFVLALENAICRDYISEKVFNSLKLDAVPIVMGGGNYSNVVPTHSVINIADYLSPKALADYLKILDKNDTLYNGYFTWKGKFEFRDRPGFCDLCMKLNHLSQSKTPYKNMYNWYVRDAKCRRWNSQAQEWSIDEGLT